MRVQQQIVQKLAVTAILACLAGTVSGQGGVANTGIPSDRVSPELRAQLELIVPYQAQVRAATTTQELLAAAAAARDRAEQRLAANQSHSEDLFALAGDAFERAGEVDGALAAYRRIVDDGKTIGWKAYAHYRRGCILPASRRPERIVEYAAAANAIMNANLDIDELTCLYLSVTEWSLELSRAGRYQEAIDTRARLRARPGVWQLLTGERRANHIISDARDLCKLGRVQDALDAWDSLAAESPTFGHDDGKIVLFLIERANRCAANPGSSTNPGTLEDLRVLWHDPDYSKMPEIMQCGAAIIWACNGPNVGAQVIPWRTAIVDRWRDSHIGWKKSVSGERYKRAQDVFTSEYLGYLSAMISKGEYQRAVQEANGFLAEYPECEQSAEVERLRDYAISNL